MFNNHITLDRPIVRVFHLSMGDTEISPRGEATSSISPLTEFPQQHNGIYETSTSMIVCRYDTLLKLLAPDKTHVSKSQTISNISIPSDSNSVVSTNYCSIAQSKMFESSCSVYKQLMSILRPRTLSCMASSSILINTRALDSKAKIWEGQQLEAEVQQFIASETPMQRIRRTFTLDVTLGRRPPQFERFVVVMKSILAGTFGLGYILGWQQANSEFMRLNKVTMFASKGAANKRRYNQFWQSALKNGIKYMVTGGGFCVSFYFLHQFIDVYTNKSTPFSMAASFGIAGCLARFNVGFKGMFAGGVIGTVLGLIGGIVTFGVLKLTNETQEDLNYEIVKIFIVARRQLQKDSTADVEYEDEVDDIE